jgi:hypothetical protein
VAVSEDASGGGNPRDRHQELKWWQSSLGRWVDRFAIGGKRENRGRKNSLLGARAIRIDAIRVASTPVGFAGPPQCRLGVKEGSFVEMRDLTRITMLKCDT